MYRRHHLDPVAEVVEALPQPGSPSDNMNPDQIQTTTNHLVQHPDETQGATEADKRQLISEPNSLNSKLNRLHLSRVFIKSRVKVAVAVGRE